MDIVLSAIGIDKSYTRVHANVNVSLDIREGEIHAVLGENGAGKSTLMRILYGMEIPDSGSIELHGRPLVLSSPRDAIRAGIGMVHQHFMLVPTLTVLENLILGGTLAGRGVLRLGAARSQIAALAERYHIAVDLDRIVGQLSVGEQQRVEILKVLVRGAKVLILDEPTAVLTPQEIAELMATLRQLAKRGFSIFIVTHKLSQAMEVSDRISVMRLGRLVGTWATSATTVGDLVTNMIGRVHQQQLSRSDHPPGAPVLRAEGLRVMGDRGREVLTDLNIEIRAGEIVGVAGIEGNGQRELAEVITGLRPVLGGDLVFEGVDIRRLRTIDILRAGVSLIPEDRHRDGLVLEFSVGENAVLVLHREPPFCARGLVVREAVSAFASRLIEEFTIRCFGVRATIRSLSGGNQQKLILGREIARHPKLLVAMQPTRGLDVGAIDYVHGRLLEGRNAGMAILLISTELEEVLALSDRIAVLREGRIVGMLDRAEATEEELGRLMLGQDASAMRAVA